MNFSQNEDIIKEDLEFEEKTNRKHTSINSKRKAKDNEKKLNMVIKSELKNTDANAGTVLRELEKYRESAKHKTQYGGETAILILSFADTYD